MKVEVAMPRLSDSMTEGAITSWFKNEGETVSEGEAIAEIETDKSTVDLNAPSAGVLARIAVAAGSGNVPVGTLLAEIETDAAGAQKAAPAAAQAPAAAASQGASPQGTASQGAQPRGNGAAQDMSANAPTAPEAKAEKPDAVATASAAQPDNAGSQGEAGTTIPSSDAPQGRNAQAAQPQAAAPAMPPPSPAKPPATSAPAGRQTNGAAHDDDDVPATPLARRMAAQAGLSLAELGRSGIGGKVCKADVEQALAGSAAANKQPSAPAVRVAAPAQQPAQRAPGAPPPPAPSPATKAYEAPQPSVAAPMSRMRRAVAERMARAKATIPHFYLSADCRVDRLIDVRERLKADGVAISLNDFVVRAAAIALRRVPEANASWGDAGITQHERVDIAVAVALDEGLVTPVVRAADTLGLEAIGENVRDLAARARQGKLAPHEYDGGTFTISNLGMFGVGELFAIINPPQVCILGVGAAEPRPVVEDGQVVAGTVMTLTISADHRVLDGATGARLLAEVKRLLEEPARMLL